MNNENRLKTGTTTIGLVYKDGVLLAADKKSTMGGRIVANNKEVKIILINDRIAVTTAGLVSDIQMLTKVLRAQVKLEELRRGKRLNAREALNLLSGLVYGNVRKLSTVQSVVGFLMASADENGVHLFDVGMDGSVTEYDSYATDGSGMMFAMGVLDADYKKHMNLEDAKKVAIKAINSAIQRDTASGSGIDIVTVTIKGTEKIYTKLLDTKL